MKKNNFIFVGLLALFLFPNLVFAQTTTEVNTDDTLRSCVNVDSSICKLTSNIELVSELQVAKTSTIDLNGYVISPKTNFTNKGGLIKVDYDGNLTINDSVGTGKITTNSASGIYGGIQIASGVYDESKTSTLKVNGGTIEGYYYGIVGNGNNHNTNIIINGGNITAVNTSDCLGIYHPQRGKLTINGGNISGTTGIEMRAGELIVNGGTITGTGIPVKVNPNGSGTTTTGAGIAIAQHTTKLNISLNINGGIIKGYSALYESNPQNNTASDLEKINIEITDGTLNSINGGTLSVYSQNFDEFITGGEFNTNITDYIKENCIISNQSGLYTVAEKHMINITPKENGTVQTNTNESVQGKEISITSTPKEGYELTSVSVLDESNNEIIVNNNKFIMPNSEVTVNGIFEGITYNFVTGANSVYNNTDLVFKLDGLYELFDYILINDKEIDTNYFTVKKGSTIITLSNEYLKTLSANTYTLKVVYKNGTTATTSFKINGVLAENPNTFDGILLYGIFGFIMLLGFIGTIISLRKIKN